MFHSFLNSAVLRNLTIDIGYCTEREKRRREGIGGGGEILRGGIVIRKGE
jgi:hypothetical protein